MSNTKSAMSAASKRERPRDRDRRVPREWLTVNEVAEVVACHPKTIRRMIRQGRLPAHTVLGQVRIHRDELKERIARIVPPPRRSLV
jgi:excisionase family DNA binding protein